MLTRATGQKCKCVKSKMADGRHFENRQIAISQWNIVRFRWNSVYYSKCWTRKPIAVTRPKIEIFGIQDGGDRHLENRFFGHNSLTDCPISAKFCVRKQNGTLTKAIWQKLQIFKIQDGGRPPFWKSLYSHISVKNRPILMKFCTLYQILNPITVTWPKLKFLKFEMATAAILKIAFFGHNSLTDCPISAKFCTRNQNGMPTKATWQKLQIFKIE